MRRAVAAGGHGAPGQAEAQLQGLGKLQHRVANAQGASLASIRAEVVASVAATQAFVQQARTATTTAEAAEVALHAASAAARQEVKSFVHDFYEEKKFDPYLQFASAEDEAAYRKREAERREAIDKAMAEGTPEATARALQLAKDQLKDAGAHGADRSPDYLSTLNGIDASKAQLANAIDHQEGKAAPEKSKETARAAPAGDPLAALRAAGVSLADQDQSGHGITERVAVQATGRTQG